jgi:hypothetical protein
MRCFAVLPLSGVLGFANLCVLCGFIFSSVFGFACPVSEIGAVLPLSGVLGFACPVSEIGANLCVRRLCAVAYGFIFSGVLGFAALPLSGVLGFAIPCGRRLSAEVDGFIFSTVLGFACPVSEIGVLPGVRRLCAVVYGSTLHNKVGVVSWDRCRSIAGMEQ